MKKVKLREIMVCAQNHILKKGRAEILTQVIPNVKNEQSSLLAESYNMMRHSRAEGS